MGGANWSKRESLKVLSSEGVGVAGLMVSTEMVSSFIISVV